MMTTMMMMMMTMIVIKTDDFENQDFDQEASKLVSELGKVVSKVRKIVKLFCKSPVRNDDNL